MISGYIKLFRQLVEWGWYTDTPVKSLFLHFLLKANHKTKKWQGIEIKPGQFITSLDNLSSETGLTKQQVRTALKKLKSTHEITHETNRHFSIITVQNWKRYQPSNTPSNIPITHQQHTDNIPITLTKNEKNEENINLSLINEEERKILESFANRRKVDNVSGYLKTIIRNGDYVDILAEERKRIERKHKYEKSRFYSPPEPVKNTPEEEQKIAELMDLGRKKLRSKQR